MNVMLGFKRFRSAAITVSSIVLTHRIRKGQFDLTELGLTELDLTEITSSAVWNAVFSIR
jgi:hypothetical protein